nr:MAG TPA: nucelotide kinase [Bacteriophage sp.]
MNTNSKHYELLAIEPWDIMEANFPPEQFVAYLKGNIIKYTLRDKGQALTDAQKIKHYAEKLIEVLETKENDKDNWTITGVKPEEPEVKHKFKVGDRVKIKNMDQYKGVIIRTPTEKYTYKNSYLICLDKNLLGWKALRDKEGIDAENVWQTRENDIELLQEKQKKTLEPNKWYDAEDFTVEELKELLPVGTKVIVTLEHDSRRTPDLENEKLMSTLVKDFGSIYLENCTRVGVTGCCFWRRYFKIEEEN